MLARRPPSASSMASEPELNTAARWCDGRGARYGGRGGMGGDKEGATPGRLSPRGTHGPRCSATRFVLLQCKRLVIKAWSTNEAKHSRYPAQPSQWSIPLHLRHLRARTLTLREARNAPKPPAAVRAPPERKYAPHLCRAHWVSNLLVIGTGGASSPTQRTSARY